jgi:AraC-like DNA-binding protein
VAGLSRALYLSRRALGRRFVSRRLPVPSHWLQFSRLLRATIQLQRRRHTLEAVAMGLGYPDGFSLSNQMTRLTGVRPSMARERLGWEWLMEAWLGLERDNGTVDIAGRSGALTPPGKRIRTSTGRSATPGLPGRPPLPWRTPAPALGRPRR